MTFQVTCVGQLSQFLRCFSIWNIKLYSYIWYNSSHAPCNCEAPISFKVMKITYDGVRDRELNRYVFSSFPNTDKVTSEVNREIKCITHIRHLITCALQSSEFSHKTFLICVKTTTHPASKTLSHINSATRTCLYTGDGEWIYFLWYFRFFQNSI